jgi:hypothetical protein
VREATGVGKTAVCEYVNRARVVGITWPIPPEINDAELERPWTATGPNQPPPLSGTQQIDVVFLKAAGGTCRSLHGSGDAVGRQSIG